MVDSNIIIIFIGRHHFTFFHAFFSHLLFSLFLFRYYYIKIIFFCPFSANYFCTAHVKHQWKVLLLKKLCIFKLLITSVSKALTAFNFVEKKIFIIQDRHLGTMIKNKIWAYIGIELINSCVSIKPLLFVCLEQESTKV